MKVKMFLRKNASIILLYLIVILLVLPLSVVTVKASPDSETLYRFSAVFIEEGNTAFSRVFDHLFLSRDIDMVAKVKS